VREDGINNLQPGEASNCGIYGGIVGYKLRLDQNIVKENKSAVQYFTSQHFG
jgi:hypothetical protein